MRHRFIGASLFLALTVLVPTLLEAQGPAKKGGGKVQVQTTADSDQLPPGTFVGYLKSTPSSDRTFTLTLENKKLEPAGGGNRNNTQQVYRILQAQNQIQQAQMRLQTARTPQQRQQAMQQLLRAQIQVQQANIQTQRSALGRAKNANAAPPGFRWVTTKQDIDFQTMDDVKVRTNILPETFDEKGNLKKYTSKELAELKGKDKNLIGYESSLEKLEVGQKVQVSLAPARKADKGADDDDKKMQVKMIVILEESTMAGKAAAAKTKKK